MILPRENKTVYRLLELIGRDCVIYKKEGVVDEVISEAILEGLPCKPLIFDTTEEGYTLIVGDSSNTVVRSLVEKMRMLETSSVPNWKLNRFYDYELQGYSVTLLREEDKKRLTCCLEKSLYG